MAIERNLVRVGSREVKKRYIGNKLIFEDLGDKTEILSGEELFTDQADDSVVHVEMDGKIYQEDEPSPDNPSEIHSVNDFDVVSSVGKRNLIIRNTETPNTWISVSGSIDRTNNHDTSDYIKVEPNTDYMLTKSNSELATDAGFFRWSWYDVDMAYIGRRADSNNEILWKTPDVVHYVRVSYPTDSIPKLEKGNKATDWTLAPEDITENDNHPLIDKINISLDEPLRSVGDVKDRLFRDSDGLWKVERNVKEEIFNGAESHSRYSVYDTETNYCFGGANITNRKYVKGEKSNSLKFVPNSHIQQKSGEDECMALHTTAPQFYYIRINKSRLSESDILVSFKAWLKENPIIFQYALSSPSIEILDQELQDKLNNLRSFQDSNNVYTVLNKTDISPTVAENLKPTLHTTFKSKGWYDYYLKTLLK